MQGGKGSDKWESLHRNLLEVEDGKISNQYDILLLSETHLMNMEEPPSKDEFTFYGSNRIGPSGNKSSGGAGIIFRSVIGDVNRTHKGHNFIAIGAEINNQK